MNHTCRPYGIGDCFACDATQGPAKDMTVRAAELAVNDVAAIGGDVVRLDYVLAANDTHTRVSWERQGMVWAGTKVLDNDTPVKISRRR